jgi:signal transduction histidine kinase/predicted hydrocarbon binding protein
MSDDRDNRKVLEAELARLRHRIVEVRTTLDDLEARAESGVSDIVAVPADLDETFARAKAYVADYFNARWEDPKSARIVVSGERYILIRAASMSIEFFDLVRNLYRDRGATEAHAVARSFLFDVAHALGKADAAAFHERMGVVDPLEKLSAGPVHFAYTGWALVEIHSESAPSPDEDFFLFYDHPNTFEAEAWLRRGDNPDFPVCVMNAGYSSGWCEQSYGVPLVATEITCRAKGDKHCRFIMAPPSRIAGHLERMHAAGQVPAHASDDRLEVPEFFKRKRLEDDLRRAHDDLEVRVTHRTAELEQRNTELRAVNERLAELHRAREEFLAMISHELRTPLVTGLGYVELLLRGKLGPVSEGISKGMDVALRNLKRLAGLVDEILRYHQLSHPDSHSAMVATFDLAQLCYECAEDLRVRTGRPASSVSVEAADGLPPVLADADMIRQVIGNLLNNACHHAGSDAHISVRMLRDQGARARVKVSDDGTGMSPEMLRQATEPFVRSGKRDRGLGLGLAIARSLLAANNSELELESREGTGTTASFTLPLLAAATDEYEAAPGPRQRSQSRADRTDRADQAASATYTVPPGLRVLVVEDDEDTRSFVKLALDHHGFDVIAVGSAEEGLDQLQSFDAELLLVDLGLPGMDGLELVRRVKARPDHATTPVLLFTARAEDSVGREAEAAGCLTTIVKPVAMEELLDQIEKAVKN